MASRIRSNCTILLIQLKLLLDWADCFARNLTSLSIHTPRMSELLFEPLRAVAYRWAGHGGQVAVDGGADRQKREGGKCGKN